VQEIFLYIFSKICLNLLTAVSMALSGVIIFWTLLDQCALALALALVELSSSLHGVHIPKNKMLKMRFDVNIDGRY
jgi:hypothetical protein